jgi:hypothetical protein
MGDTCGVCNMQEGEKFIQNLDWEIRGKEKKNVKTI